MTRIRYMKGDPRAGRVVNLEPTLAKRLIDDGNAEEVGDDVQMTDAPDLAIDDGSRGDTTRPMMGPNAGPEDTTTRDATGTAMEDDAETARRKSTQAKANKQSGGGSSDK